MTDKLMEMIVRERPVGTTANHEIADFLQELFEDMNYSVRSIPFNCVTWEKGESALSIGHQLFEIKPSPFSETFEGSGKLIMARTAEELSSIDCKDAILLLAGKLTESPLQPKNYPFYYPDEHKYLIALLEEKKPKAIIAATGQHPLSGQNPFPLFDDGNFLIPSGNISLQTLLKIESMGFSNEAVHLRINSRKLPAKGRQIIASKKSGQSAGKIVIGAHMDTKYDTPGALDNGAGVAVMLQVAEAVKAKAYDIDFVPFNTEEYFGACGELEYLKQIDGEKDKIKLMINIDSPCHKGAKTAISSYNMNDSMNQIVNDCIRKSQKTVKGEAWYAGDHIPFVFSGIPCLAVTSSDLFSGALEYTHTPKDTLDIIDFEMIDHTAECLVMYIKSACKRSIFYF